MNWILALVGLPLLAACLYLLVLTLLSRRPSASPRTADHLRFVVLVPAHNEERGIAATIDSLTALDYPADRRRVVVVADNCSDRTAVVAAQHGADVLVRHDTGRVGKGYALQYAIDSLLASAAQQPWDALVVIDADSSVSPNLLRSFATCFEAGEVAVQAAYLPRRTGNGAVSVITDVALYAFHIVRSTARERLGVSCGLRGNGMGFRRALLAAVPHTAFSRTEDLEFGVLLGMRGIRVGFAADALVRGDMPEQAAAVVTQRERWIGGRVGLARRFVPALVRDALRQRSLMLADLAADIVVPPLSVLALATVGGLAASLVLSALLGGVTIALTVWATAFAALASHVAHAAWLAGQGRAFLRAAWSLPGYALGKTTITIKAWKPSDERWHRTPRQGE